MNQDKCRPDALTIEAIYQQIDTDTYHLFPKTQVAVCLLTLINGHHVVGVHETHPPEPFNYETAYKNAFDNAVAKVFDLEYYRLASTKVKCK